jgi:hypothetical protein
MKSMNCIEQKKTKKRQPAFVSRPDLATVSYSRWHGIKFQFSGRLYLFEMNVNDHPLSSGETRLGHVKIADNAMDEWVEMPHAFLEECRANTWLMEKLNERVDEIEAARMLDDAASDADGSYHEVEPEVVEEE